MRLKSVEIQGYKSFANKVKIVFDGGLTAVVGPNGSGKSNVVDAIRWVLGEQSYSSLRGRKTADMIFAGSDGRARLSMAAVTLLLDNTEKWLPLDFSEVTISRRAYRSGENEYYLNGSRVRLKDVTELLAQGGLSRQTYTVIGQGTIDRILSLQSTERRRLFEEAAGIVFHRQKRQETLERLEATQANLLRVNDLVQELAPQVKRLARQAARVTEYHTLMTELADRLTLWYGYRWQAVQRQQRQAEIHRQTCEQTFKVQQTQLSEVEAQLTELRDEQRELRHQVGDWYAQSREISQQAEAVQRQLAVSGERTHQFEVQQQEISDDLHLLRTNLSGQQQQVGEDEAALSDIQHALQAAEAELTRSQTVLASHQAQQQQVISQRMALEKEQQAVLTRLTRQQTRLNQLHERQQTLTEEQHGHATEMERLQMERAQLQAEQVTATAALERLQQSLAELGHARDAERARLTTLQEQVAEQQRALAPLRREEDSLQARLEALNRLRSDMEGYHEGVRAVLNPHSGLAGVIGTISQIIQVPPELEVAIEVVLGGRLQDIVMENFDDAQRAINHLKTKRLGRATLLPLDSLRVPSPMSLPRTAGVIGLASALVQTEPHLRRVAEFALNRTLVTEDLPAARQAFNTLKGGFTLVTRDGELVRSSGAVTGGQSRRARNQGTFLAREREWRALPEQIETLRQQGQAVLTQIETVQHDLATVEQRIEQLTEARRTVREQVQTEQAQANALSRKLEQATSRLDWHGGLQDKSEAELSQLAEQQAELEAEVGQLTRQRDQFETALQQLAAEDHDSEMAALVEAVNQARTEVATIRESQQKQQAMVSSRQTMQQQLMKQIQAKEERQATLLKEQTVLESERGRLQQQHDGLQGQVATFNQQIEQSEQAVADLETVLTERVQVEKSLRQQWQRLEAQLREAAIDAARREDELQALRRQVEDDLGLVLLEVNAMERPPDQAVSKPTQPDGEPQIIQTDDSGVISPESLPVVSELPEGIERAIKQARNKLRRLGNVNAEATHEHAELSQRYDFLTAQIADLEEAATNLKAVITKLDGVMHETFAETFQKVSTEFKKYFKAMFGGGEADILLTDPDDLTNTGVDIMARPPGKRLQSMALLSGGERSLTAQALIFSLLTISPTPFVIFDEVDAMLDEANVGRFRDALVGLASEIQFIVVTHNRRTIEAADMIYGVSMGSDSVSQIFSLRLDEWEEKLGNRVVKA